MHRKVIPELVWKRLPVANNRPFTTAMGQRRPLTPPVSRRLRQMTRVTARDVTIRPHLSAATGRPEFLSLCARPENSEDVPYPLTKEEALKFARVKLSISHPESKAAKDSLGLLNHIADKLKRKVPFTNMDFFQPTPLWELSPDGHKKLILSLEGGMCWTINPFTKAFLERFGYNCRHICGYNPGDPIQDSHLSIVVEDVVYQGSLHLVDPGTRRNLGAAIPLDFGAESPVYDCHGTKTKFFKRGNRVAMCSQTVMPDPSSKYTEYDSTGKEWKQQVVYCLDEQRNWYPFVTNTRDNFFRTLAPGDLPQPYNGLVFSGFLKDQMMGIMAFRDGIFKYSQNRDGTHQRETMSKPALLRLFRENFPQYSEEKLQELFERCPIY